MQKIWGLLLLFGLSAQEVPQSGLSQGDLPQDIPLNEAAVPIQLGGGDAAVGIPSGVSASLYIRIFLILGFLIVLIYFTLKFLRRLSLQRPPLPGSASGIRVLSSQILHGQCLLHVVEVGGECYLLGSSANGVQLLDHYTVQEIKDRVILEVTQEPQANATRDFLQLLRSRLRPQTPENTVGSRTGERLRAVAQSLNKKE